MPSPVPPRADLKRQRPRGLWKGRVNPPRCFAQSVREWQQRIYRTDSDTDEDHDDDNSEHDLNNASRAKCRRVTPSFSDHDSDSDPAEHPYRREFSHSPSPHPARVSSWVRQTRTMDTTTTAGRGIRVEDKCDFEDWEDLKDLFAKAAGLYESAEPSEALPIIRAVVHECHRFLVYYHDPSVIFCSPRLNTMTPSVLTPTEERMIREWDSERSSRRSVGSPPSPLDSRRPSQQELPTAFHAILGAALFIFGNLIAQNPELALPGEPGTPCPYWLAALDVFETGENLPSRTDGRCAEPPEDWRMAIVWGRTLVCIADEALTAAAKSKQSGSMGPSPQSCLSAADQFAADEPNWPQESPFSAIAARRPPVTRRMTLSSNSPHELMVLAMDQFSRGIFHMPHPQHQRSPTFAGSTSSAPPLTESFSRANELYTIASEVLAVAEKFELSSERQYWASWADSVFNQMKMEADTDAWRGPILRARGRCWLIVGSAKVEEIESALEAGDMDILRSEDAEEAREGLSNAIDFFDRAKGSASLSTDTESADMQPLLAEALLTLANLSLDSAQRETLYARAQKEAGSHFSFSSDDDAMDQS
ncbi:hypothetical protein HGRIS_005221 [Hohenbuehelia grisea]|uniref:Uncharacterized protein n=1 Tax=Hohenbuehelia grisea TaxID=104357 RepID=A0ABR3JFU3_9AGAR